MEEKVSTLSGRGGEFMEGPMEPIYPCVWMETRPCVDGIREITNGTEGAYVEMWYRREVCPKVCTRYGKDVNSDYYNEEQ